MGFIQNYSDLSITPERKVVLDLIEAAISSIQPKNVMRDFALREDKLFILDKVVNLEKFERIFLLGFGKGSAGISKIIEQELGSKIDRGYVIDTQSENFEKLEFTQGKHPLPSKENINFTNKVIDELGNLTIDDLILVVICGGGSAMLESPTKISLEKLIHVNHTLLKNGADIFETNTIRKHLSKVKGGGLAKALFPAKIVSLIFSDVPGNDLSTIASGPTVPDTTTIEDAMSVIEKYEMDLTKEDLEETPKESEIFENVENILMLSNKTALAAMQKKAESLGMEAIIYTDQLKSEARIASKTLIDNTKPDSVLLAGGETTVKVKNKEGLGGRNQEVALSSLSYISDTTTLAAFDSDGWDNSEAAGAIIDVNTKIKAQEKKIEPEKYLEENNSLVFCEKVGDAIITGRLPSNVSDLFIVYRK
jgi:glycerate 2-kinase